MSDLRTKNFNTLIEELPEECKILDYSRSPIPSHLVIMDKRAKEIQQFLAKKSIYCPIHWPQPACAMNRQWRTDLVSVHIDHRYDTSDMRRTAHELAEFFATRN